MEKQARTQDVRLIPIGNSKVIRIPKTIITKYGFQDRLCIEETERGILLRQKDEYKLSWPDTFRAMAEEKEDWEDFNDTLLDGLEEDLIDAETI
jgi:antitoxin MazE